MLVIHRGGGNSENLGTESVAQGVQMPIFADSEVYN